MKLRINICHIYLFVILLCALNGTLYVPGGIVSQALQMILILMSLYYAFYANAKYKLPVYFKGLNLLLVMFTIYGVLLLFSGERIVFRISYEVASNTEYLKSIYKSLLPIYPFYVFTKQGLLKESTMKIWFFVFLVLAVKSYFDTQQRQLEAALERGSSAEEFTNNVGYTFAGLLPALVLFKKKPIIQYFIMAVCTYFIVIAMKRGAVLVGVVCLVWFMIKNIQNVPKKRRWIIFIVTVVAVYGAVYLFNYMKETSAFFLYRLEQTRAGESSGRETIFKYLIRYFVNDNNTLHILFGNGANATIKISGNFAHNDWLEVLINQGLLGFMIHFVYWLYFYISWRTTRYNAQPFMALGMIFITYFVSSLFSMSYNCVTHCSAMVLGYYLAVGYDVEEFSMESQNNKSAEIGIS